MKNKILKRRIGGAILDFYALSTILGFLFLPLAYLGVEIVFEYVLSFVLLVILITIFYHYKSSSNGLVSIGELYFGIEKDKGEIKLLKYDWNRMLSIIGAFIVVIPLSNIYDGFTEGQPINRMTITYILMLVLISINALYNYPKFGGLKNSFPLLIVCVLMNRIIYNGIEIGYNFASIPIIIWAIIIGKDLYMTYTSSNK